MVTYNRGVGHVLGTEVGGEKSMGRGEETHVKFSTIKNFLKKRSSLIPFKFSNMLCILNESFIRWIVSSG